MTRLNNLHVLPERIDALLVANGASMPRGALRELRCRARRTIALDGGCAQCRRAQIVPDVLLGDFDSVRAGDLGWARSHGAQILKRTSQERSDVQKGLDYAVAHRYKEVVMVSVGGSRLDHTLAILQDAETRRGLNLYLVSAETIALPLKGRASRQLLLSGGCTCSWFALHEAKGCTLSGVRWPFQNRGLGSRHFHSLSNVVTNPPLCASQRSGTSWLMVQLAR